MTDPLEQPTPRRLLSDAAPGTLGTLIDAGMQALGADPISSALGGLAVGTALALDRAGFAPRLARGQGVVEQAAEELGGHDELIARATHDDRSLELTMTVLEAAARTTYEEKLKALSRVLARGLQDDVADDVPFLVAAVTDLEAPHVQTLRTIESDARDRFVEAAPNTGTYGWTDDILSQAQPGLKLVLPTVIRVLELHGLIRNIALKEGFGGAVDRWAISGLGVLMLELLGDQDSTGHDDAP